MKFSAIVAMIILSVGCTKKNDSAQVETTGKDKQLKIGIVLDKGGRDDKSFNAAAVKGGKDAIEKLGVDVKDVETSDDNAFEPAMRTFVSRGYDLIIGVGFSQGEAISKVAKEFPESRFAIVDFRVDNVPNVQSLLFNEHEGSYLVGMIAGLTTKTQVVGFVGGMDIPLIRRFELGYQEGVKAANPKTKILSNFVGNTSDAWNNPTKAKELANSQYGQKADIIFQAAGASGMGVFDAAEEKQLFAIGVDSNQNWVKPGRVLTSMMKRVDVAVFEAIREVKESRFQGGVKIFGLANGGIDYALDDNNKDLISPTIIAQLDEAKKKILGGNTVVSDYYLIKKK